MKLSRKYRDMLIDKYGPYRLVVIASNNGLFRTNMMGYTDEYMEAGAYTLLDAIEVSGHCGPEKNIKWAFLNLNSKKVYATGKFKSKATTVKKTLGNCALIEGKYFAKNEINTSWESIQHSFLRRLNHEVSAYKSGIIGPFRFGIPTPEMVYKFAIDTAKEIDPLGKYIEAAHIECFNPNSNNSKNEIG